MDLISPIAAMMMQAAPTALTASSKWMLDPIDRSCELTQSFGQRGETIFTILKAPGDTAVSLRLISTQIPDGVTRVRLRNDRSGEEATALARSSSRPNLAARGLGIYRVDSRFLAGIAPGGSISIITPGQPPISLALANLDVALTALSTCEAGLLQGWKVDPAPLAKLRSLPEPAGNPDSWIRFEDYPDAALRQSAEGSTTVRYRVSRDGKLADCAVAESSGSASHDAATCRVLTRKARYHPAIGADGAPTDAWVARTVRWMITPEFGS